MKIIWGPEADVGILGCGHKKYHTVLKNLKSVCLSLVCRSEDFMVCLVSVFLYCTFVCFL
jgi:hypothetical protein